MSAISLPFLLFIYFSLSAQLSHCFARQAPWVNAGDLAPLLPPLQAPASDSHPRVEPRNPTVFSENVSGCRDSFRSSCFQESLDLAWKEQDLG